MGQQLPVKGKQAPYDIGEHGKEKTAVFHWFIRLFDVFAKVHAKFITFGGIFT